MDENALDVSPNGEAPPIMTPEEADAQFRKDLLALIPFLRAFSRSLSLSDSRAGAESSPRSAITSYW